MNKSIILLSTLLIIISSCHKKDYDSSTAKSQPTNFKGISDKSQEVHDSMYRFVGNLNMGDTVKTPKPQIISKYQYNHYVKNYHLEIDSVKHLFKKTSKEMIITTATRIIKYPSDTTDYSEFTYYKGYLPKLKAYLFDYVAASNEISNLELVDSLSGKIYILESSFDNSCEIPLPSPGYRFLLAYANDLYEQRGCFISILKIDKNKNQIYSDYRGYSFSDKRIEGIVWIDDKSFAVKLIWQDENDNTLSSYQKIRLK